MQEKQHSCHPPWFITVLTDSSRRLYNDSFLQKQTIEDSLGLVTSLINMTIHFILVCISRASRALFGQALKDRTKKKMLIYFAILANQNLAGAKKSINVQQMCLYRNVFMQLFVYSCRTSK